jgi:hypothetical protein
VWTADVTQDFKKHLHRQVGFLRRSCESYDSGHTDEGIRIATSIRVLIHDTKNSTSLLKHLRARNIKLSSTVETVGGPGTILFSGMGRATLTVGPAATVGKWEASTTADSIRIQLLVSDWWNQIVYVRGNTRLCRKDLVLAAADKDGGAHVDSKLTTDYQTLMRSGECGFFYYPDETGSFRPIMDAQLVYLRQMGHELLSSPDLLALITS